MRLLAMDCVFISPPAISDGAFQLRMDNIWFCKLLLLFKMYTKTDACMQYLECGSVCLCFCAGRVQGRAESRSYYAYLHILHNLIFTSTTAWVDQCQSAIVYERSEQAQVLYVIPVSYVLGRLPLVPVGVNGTTPFAMRRESADFP